MGTSMLQVLLGRNWRRRIAIGCGCFTLLMLVIGITVFGILIFCMRSSWAYTEGIDLACCNKVIIEELGEPVHAAWFVTGSINISGAIGEANLAIPIYGPKNKGTLYVVAHKQHGKWTFDQAAARLEGRDQEVDLLPR